MPDRAAQSTTGLKVLAVLMAIALWAFVGVSQRVGFPMQSRKHLSVEIGVEHPPPQERVHVIPPFADVVVEGPARAVDQLSESDVRAFVDLRFQQPGRNVPVLVSVPDGLKYQVTPEIVNLVALPDR